MIGILEFFVLFLQLFCISEILHKNLKESVQLNRKKERKVLEEVGWKKVIRERSREGRQIVGRQIVLRAAKGSR